MDESRGEGVEQMAQPKVAEERPKLALEEEVQIGQKREAEEHGKERSKGEEDKRQQIAAKERGVEEEERQRKEPQKREERMQRVEKGRPGPLQSQMDLPITTTQPSSNPGMSLEGSTSLCKFGESLRSCP